MLVPSSTLVALLVVPFVGFRLYARRVESLEEPREERLHRIRRAMQLFPFGIVFVTVPAVFLAGTVEWLLGGFESLAPGLYAYTTVELGAIVAVSMGIVALPLLSAFLGMYPTWRSLREVDLSTRRAVKGVLAALALVFVPVVAWIGFFFALPSIVRSSTVFIVGTFALFVLTMFGIQPYLVALLADRVPLDGERRKRIRRLCDDVGFEPRGVYLIEGTSAKEANALVAGTVPGFQYVFLTDYLVTECDDDELRAILAHEYGHVVGYHLWQRGLLVVGTFGVWMIVAESFVLDILEAQFGFLGIFVPLMLCVLFLFVVLLGGLTLWQEFRADAFAARTAGPDATVTALETLAEANDMRRETGLVYSLLTYHPPIADRIERVRKTGRDQ